MTFRLTLQSIALASMIGAPVLAQTVTLETEANDDLRGVLESASLTLGVADADETPTALDYVAAARADYRRILTGLYSEGYYGGSVSILIDGREAAGIAPLDAPETINEITIIVDSGPRFKFRTAEVAPVAAGTEMPDRFATGRIARSTVITEAVDAAVTGWRDNGYAKAEKADQSIVANHPTSELDATVAITTGPRLTFGTLAVEGNEGVRTTRIVKIAGLPTGKVFSPEALEISADRLQRTGAFSAVTMVEGDQILAGDVLPVTVQVVEMPPRRLGFGAELSSVEGLRLSGYWMHRNLLGGAENFRIEGDISGIGGGTGGLDYGVDATLKIPRPLAVDTELELGLAFNVLDETSFYLEELAIEANLSRVIAQDTTISGGVGLVTARTRDAYGSREYTLFTLPISGLRDKRDNALDATTGYYAKAEVTPFVGIAGSDSGGLVYGDGRVYRSFGSDDAFTLAARGQIGALLGADPENAPSNYLFYSGGGDTVRGHGYQSLGVDLPSGETIGGSAFAAVSVEGRYDFGKNFGGVAFYDAGFVGASSDFSDLEMQAGAGIGLRYNTGIGPIRLDVATPVTGDDAYQSVNFYVGIGQAF